MRLILHLSDLHFEDNAAAYNTEAILCKEATQKAKSVPFGEKMLIITGDLHNYSDENYKKAENLIKKLVNCMGLDINQDVFIIPGNHDVGNDKVLKLLFEKTDSNWKKHNKATLAMLKSGDTEYITERLYAFRPYSIFAQQLGIYNTVKGEDYPSQVHLRNWRGKLNILHLNTALIADGKSKTEQMVDTTTAAADETWKDYFDDTIPSIAIGHNNFFDLAVKHRRELETTFSLKNISAYLCGDNHLTEANPERQMIRLESGHFKGEEIPNLVAARGIADGNDTYSEVGWCWHYWNEENNEVTVDFRKWTSSNLAKTTGNGEKGFYIMRSENKRKAANQDASDVNMERPNRIKELLLNIQALIPAMQSFRSGANRSDNETMNASIGLIGDLASKLYDFAERYYLLDQEVSQVAKDLFNYYEAFAKLYAAYISSGDIKSADAQNAALGAGTVFNQMLQYALNSEASLLKMIQA